MKSIEGKCLVASPHLDDPNFFRSVVLIIRHNETEAFGLLLNRPTDQLLNPILEEQCEIICKKPLPVYVGGPVDGPIVALHDQKELAELDCFVDGVYLSSSETNLIELAENHSGAIRVFAGYSGWGPNQLDDELEMGGWLVVSITHDELFGPSNEIWENLMNKVGRDIIEQLVDQRSIPTDPSCN